MDDIDGARMARATLAKLERPESPRTAAATAARRRQSEERAAARLRERGWLAVPPEHVQAVREAATYHVELDDGPGLELAGTGRG